MKFSLKDFLELDTKSLFAVNGGSDCGGSSSPSGGGSDSPSSPTGNGPGSGVSNGNSHGNSGGGYCSGASDGKTVYENPYYKGEDGNQKGNGSSEKIAGGGCSNFLTNSEDDSWTSVFNGDDDKSDGVDPAQCGHLGKKVSADESKALLSEMANYEKNDGGYVGFTQRGFGTGNINVYTMYNSAGHATDYFYDCDHDGVIDYAAPAN